MVVMLMLMVVRVRVIKTHCSIPFVLFNGVFVSAYCTLLQCFLCVIFLLGFILFCEALCNPVLKSATQIQVSIIIIGPHRASALQ